MNRSDIRRMNRALNDRGDGPGLIAAIDRLEELHRLEDEGMGVPDDAWRAAQNDAQRALVDVWDAADDAIDRSGQFEAPAAPGSGGNPQIRDLPAAAITRSNGRPQRPDEWVPPGQRDDDDDGDVTALGASADAPGQSRE